MKYLNCRNTAATHGSEKTLMDLSYLEKLNNDKIIDFIKVPLTEVEKRYLKAYQSFQFVVSAINAFGKENKFNDEIYRNLYEAARLACEAYLLLEGIKVKNKDHHYWVMEITEKYLKGNFKSEFGKIRKMRKKRHAEMYELLTLSSTEIKNLLPEIKLLFLFIKDKVLKAKLKK